MLPREGRGQGHGGRACSLGAGAGREPRHLLLELIGHEQELAPREPPDVEFAEVLKLAVDLLLADPWPLPDGEDEDGGADARGVWACKVLEDREEKQKRFPTAPREGPPTQLVLEGREEKRFPTLLLKEGPPTQLVLEGREEKRFPTAPMEGRTTHPACSRRQGGGRRKEWLPSAADKK